MHFWVNRHISTQRLMSFGARFLHHTRCLSKLKSIAISSGSGSSECLISRLSDTNQIRGDTANMMARRPRTKCTHTHSALSLARKPGRAAALLANVGNKNVIRIHQFEVFRHVTNFEHAPTPLYLPTCWVCRLNELISFLSHRIC